MDWTSLGRRGGLILLLVVFGLANPVDGNQTIGGGCELPAPATVRREGNSIWEMWNLSATGPWLGSELPRAPGYIAYRAAIRSAGGDVAQPAADPPKPKDAAERELWRREDLNVALMYAGSGEIRPVRCLEAVLFARQDARYSQLTRPTEFVAHVLRRSDSLRVYFGATDQMFPPREFIGSSDVVRDVAAGWQYWVILHNHTVGTLQGKPALGVPVPSTSDVDFFRSLARRLGLREAWITNGIYTGVVTAENLDRFSGRDQRW